MASDLVEHFERINWCVTETDRIKSEFDEFLATKPYEIVERPKYGFRTPTKQIIAKSTAPIPKGISIRVGTTTNEIRSILDALASTLAVRNNKTKNGVYFPIARSHDDFLNDKTVREKIKKLADADVKLIENLRPWPGGNDLLCALHQVDVTRKHNGLVLMASSPGVTHVHIPLTTGAFSGHVFPSGQKSMEEGAIIADDVSFDAASIEIKFEPIMCFSEPTFLVGKNTLTVMGQFAGVVKSALKIFD